MKVLNLDALANEEVAQKSVTLGGVEYPVKEMSVADFIIASKEAEELKSSKDPVADIASWIKHIQRVIPSLAESTVRGLTLPQLMILMQFVTSTVEDEAAAGKIEEVTSVEGVAGPK